MSAATAGMVRRSVGKVNPQSSVMLLCDIQDRFVPLIHKSATVVQTSRLLTSVAAELKIPVVVTEQYKKVFGPTATACFLPDTALTDGPSVTKDGAMPAVAVFEKKLFSMMTSEVDHYLAALQTSRKVLPANTSYILFGIEAHVCVQQTCLDLLERGHDVHVVVDACSSMKVLDRNVALERMQQAGAYLTTSQSIVFMLMQTAHHAKFKTVSSYVKENAKLVNEFNASLMAQEEASSRAALGLPKTSKP